jgi:CheY-like chemotaxis protein
MSKRTPGEQIRDDMQSAEHRRGTRGVRALLVEDSKPCEITASAILRKAGYSVERHRGALGARCALDGRGFDLALIDANIPEDERTPSNGAAGIEVARLIREVHPRCRVIVWSSDAAFGPVARTIGASFVLKGDRTALNEVILGAPYALDAWPNEDERE